MNGIDHWGVEPDIMTLAKGVANGMPLGVTITTEEIARSFTKATLSTFGGNPVVSAAANATLEVIESEDLPANAAARGAQLRAGLEDLQRRFPKTIGDVRGMGLMQAMELVADETAGDRTPNTAATLRLFEETKQRGLLIGKGGLHGNVIRITPTLTVSAAEVDAALRILGESFAAFAS
jgi:4-aminobutyrate aminotransferase-like enzyme